MWMDPRTGVSLPRSTWYTYFEITEPKPIMHDCIRVYRSVSVVGTLKRPPAFINSLNCSFWMWLYATATESLQNEKVFSLCQLRDNPKTVRFEIQYRNKNSWHMIFWMWFFWHTFSYRTWQIGMSTFTMDLKSHHASVLTAGFCDVKSFYTCNITFGQYSLIKKA